MSALDLGPGDRLPALATSYLNRADVRELFQVRLDRAPEQRRLWLVGAPCRTSQRGVDLGREFQAQLGGPSKAK